jgi:hypothetical protein
VYATSIWLVPLYILLSLIVYATSI